MNKEKEEQVANEARQKQADRMMALCSSGEMCRLDICNQDYVKNLQVALKNKAAQLKESNPLKRREKLVRFGLGRGYTYEQIYKLLKQESY